MEQSDPVPASLSLAVCLQPGDEFWGGKISINFLAVEKKYLFRMLSLPEALLQEKEASYPEQLQHRSVHRLSSVSWSRDKRGWFGSQLPVWHRGGQ